MRRAAATVAIAVAIVLVSIPPMRASSEPAPDHVDGRGSSSPASYLVDGQVICGAIGDATTDAYEPIFTYSSTGERIRPDNVIVGGVELPTASMDDAVLSVMELHHVASRFSDQTTPEPFCVRVSVRDGIVAAVTVESGTATVCGRQMMYAMPFRMGISEAIGDPGWTVFFPEDLVGYSPDAASPRAFDTVWGMPWARMPELSFCASADAVTRAAWLAGSADISVVSRTNDAIVVSTLDHGGEFEFALTPGSSVDAALVTGVQACIEVRGHAGVNGPVEMRVVQDARCRLATPIAPSDTTRGSDTTRVLPDVAMRTTAGTTAGGLMVGGAILAVLAVVIGARRHRRPA